MNSLDLFPHETVRDGQNQLIQDIEQTLSQQKILLAHAPTGLGKTASALSAALAIALEKNKKVFFLTNRHTQHKIAIDTLKDIRNKTGKNITCVDLIGKRWMCNQKIANLFGKDFNEFCKSVVEKGECEFYNNVKTKKGLSVLAKATIAELKTRGPLHNEELVVCGQDNKMCSYELAMGLSKDAQVIIGDYYYVFNPFIQSNLFNKLDIALEDSIVIVDEGHNLSLRVTDMMSASLTSVMIKNAVLEAKKFSYDELVEPLENLGVVLSNLAKSNDEQLVSKNALLQNIPAYEEFTDQLEVAGDEIRSKQQRSFLASIASFLEQWQGSDEGYTRIITKSTGKYGPFIALRYSCLDPSIATREIFNRMHAGVVMSGTLKPLEMYKDILGVEKGVIKEYGSPFPPENRCTLIVPQTTTKYTARNDSMYELIAQKCSTFASLIPGNVAFFFPSYDLRDRIGYLIESPKEYFWEKQNMGKTDKEIFLAQFKQSKAGLLLGVSGANFAEGVDFPGDLLQGVVIVGVPLGKQDLYTQQVIKYYDTKYGKGWDYGYLFPAMNKCFQGAGRCIRSETDKGAIIFLDERFTWGNYFRCFPREGLIVTKEYEKILNGFFK